MMASTRDESITAGKTVFFLLSVAAATIGWMTEARMASQDRRIDLLSERQQFVLQEIRSLHVTDSLVLHELFVNRQILLAHDSLTILARRAR
jgi:hypothetical protein